MSKAVGAGRPPSPPSPPPLLHRVAVKQHRTNFAKHEIWTKLFWISQNFAKFKENLAKHDFKYFAKSLQNYEKQNILQSPYSYTISSLLHKLPSAKTIFFCAAMLLWDEDDICTAVFHSVIYNSVITPENATQELPVWWTVCKTVFIVLIRQCSPPPLSWYSPSMLLLLLAIARHHLS